MARLSLRRFRDERRSNVCPPVFWSSREEDFKILQYNDLPKHEDL